MVDDAAFTPGGSSVTPMGALADETAPDAVDEGDVGAVRMTLTRALHVNLRDSSGNEVSVGGGTQYDEDTAHSSGDKLTMAGAVRRDTAASGASADGDRATLNVDQNGKLWVNLGTLETLLDAIKTAVEILDNAIAGNEAQVDVVAALPAGANTIGNVGVATRTSGGCTPYNNTDLQETEVEVKDTGGTVYALYCWNLTAAPLWVKLYDADADDVTPGTTTPTVDLMVPANADADGAGFAVPIPPQGWNFTNAITIHGSATRGATNADVGSAGSLGIFMLYA
jgi:hypothetical protein